MTDFPSFPPPPQGPPPQGPLPQGPPPQGPPLGGPPAPGWWLASDGRWYPPTSQPGYAPGFGYPVPRAAGTNGLAIASLVLGIVWVYWIGSILAVIFGHIALSQIRRTGQGGRGLAIAGLVLGYIGLALLAIGIIAFAAGYDSESDLSWAR